MRSRMMSALWLCVVLALGPGAAHGDGLASKPPPMAVGAGVELRWGVVEFGGGVSYFEDLALSGVLGDPAGEPFAVLMEFDPRSPRATDPRGEAPFTELALASITPNPNRGEALVSWTLPAEAWVRLSIHDIQGREVEVLATGSYPPGRHDVAWRAGRSGGGAAGVYFVRLQTPGRTLVRRMVVIR